MKRKIGLGVVVVLAIVVAMLVWRRHAAHSVAGRGETASNVSAMPVETSRVHVDPRKLERASIAGTITGDDHAPIAGARVCVDLAPSDVVSGEVAQILHCTSSDGHGNYAFGELLAGQYTVVAVAKGHLPTSYHPDGDPHRKWFELRAGEHRTGVDLVMEHGGVEISGVVSDIAGGPIAHARVRTRAGWFLDPSPSAAVETDEVGKFTTWVQRGQVAVIASAEGYADGSDSGSAPGKFEILLTPESSLAGTVVDAKTGAPVAGVAVSVADHEWGWGNDGTTDITDEAGHFRVARLEPGRYVAIARSQTGYGHSDGSTLVGLAQHVGGVVVKLYPAVRVSGRVVLPGAKRPSCARPWAALEQKEPTRYLQAQSDPDGTVHVDGVLAGSYTVHVGCTGYHAHDKYPAVVVKDKEIANLEWEVDVGATIRGRIVTKSGEPVPHATITARTTGGAARDKTGWGNDESDKDGAFKLDGLKAGEYKIEVSSTRGLAPKDGWKLQIASANAVVQKDFVLDDGGAIRGTVLDAGGAPVAEVHVLANKVGDENEFSFDSGAVRSGDDGSFTIDNVRPGDYRVVASHDVWGGNTLRKPGTDDDAKQGERVTVAPTQTASVRLVVESTAGTITGTVEDADGKPVTDAFVVAARESDAAGSQHSNIEATRWNADDHPVLTGTDGSFKITKLAPGAYTLLAQRKGGGEAIGEHVAVGTVAKLRIKPTGAIEGTVHRDGVPPDQLTIALSDPVTGLSRTERLFRSGGSYAIHDLPAGHFTITYTAEGGQKQQVVDLAEGEHKTGIDTTLDPLVTLTGRIVELGTTKPAVGIQVIASAGKSGNLMFMSSGDDDQQNISDETGRFSVVNAPAGVVTLAGWPKDWGADAEYGFFRAVRTVDNTGTGTVDIGDLPIVHKRTKNGDQTGELGIHWADAQPGAPVDEYVWKVSWIDPAGPAAKTDLKIGDVVTTIDGTDVAGANASNGEMLLEAPAGTTLQLGLARGATVAVTLAAAS